MIKSFQSEVKVSPVCDTAIYASEELIGGKLTLKKCTQGPGLGGIIQTITIVDQAMQKSALALLFFTADPTGTTFTDQAALDVDDADLRNAFEIAVVANDYVDLTDNSIATINPTVAFGPLTDETLYLAIVSKGTPTYVAATDLQVTVNITG